MNKLIESFEEFERIRNLPIDERLKYQFTEYLKSFNQSNEITELTKKINWKQIIKIYEEEFNILWEKFIIPQNIDSLKGIRDNFCLILLRSISHNLFYHIFLILKKQPKLKELNKNIIWNLNFIISEFLAPYYFQLGLTNLNEYDNEKFTIIKIKELIKKAKRGEKFSGKSFIPAEMEAFEIILQKHKEAEQNGDKRSLRSIARIIARKELGYDQEEEQYKFYKRFLNYKKKIKY